MTALPAVGALLLLKVFLSHNKVKMSCTKYCLPIRRLSRYIWLKLQFYVNVINCSNGKVHNYTFSRISQNNTFSRMFQNVCISFLQNGNPELTKMIVISVSPQSRASLAAKYNIPVQETAQKLTRFFKALGTYPKTFELLQLKSV